MSNCFTPALSKSAIKAISMMASRVSFVGDQIIRVTMPNGHGVEVYRTYGHFCVWLIDPDRGPGWNLDLLGESCDEYEVLGLCGKVAGGNF